MSTVTLIPTPPRPADAEPTYWSHSAAEKAGRCPLEWAHRNGPLREHGAPRGPGPLPQRRGNVVHEAMAAALRAAVAEVDDAPVGTTLPGSELTRYWGPARAALGQAWTDYDMPADRAEAEQTVDMLRDALRMVRIPRRGSVATIEDPREWTTPGGRPVKYVLDFAYWTHLGRLRIVDWKTGQDDPAQVATNRQLARYGLWLAESLGVDPRLIEVELHNVKTRVTSHARLDVALARRAVARIDTLAEAMEAAEAAGEFPARVGGHCTGCAVRRTCPALAAHVAPVLEDES